MIKFLPVPVGKFIIKFLNKNQELEISNDLKNDVIIVTIKSTITKTSKQIELSAREAKMLLEEITRNIIQIEGGKYE